MGKRIISLGGSVLILLMLSHVVNGQVRHLRVEVSPGVGFIGTGYLSDNAKEFKLENPALSRGSFAGDIFVGTDIANGITIGIQMGATATSKFSGRRADTIYVEPMDDSVATQWSIFPDCSGPGTILGVGRFTAHSGKHSSLIISAGLGTAHFWYRHNSTRSVYGAPVSFYSFHEYRAVNSMAAMISADVRYRPKQWVALFFRIGYLSVATAEFPAEQTMETIISPSGTEYRDMTVPKQAIKGSHVSLKLGFEISPF